MAKLRVNCFSVAIDGYGAGPDQSLENPLGVGGLALHQWMLGTRTFQHMQGNEGGSTGPDDEFVVRGMSGIGAWILGRNMFGPIRGPWPDDSWRGWWGENPPYHTPVFVLTSSRARRCAWRAGPNSFRDGRHPLGPAAGKASRG
jgi:dihydrofolate reductase